MRKLYIIIISALAFSHSAMSEEKKAVDNISKLLPADKEAVQEQGYGGNNQMWSLGSIMYTPEHIDQVKKAIMAHEQRIPLSKLLPEIFSPKAKKTRKPRKANNTQPIEQPVEQPIEPIIVLPKEAPAFYLSSILYISPDNWSVWINGEKISYGENYNDVELVKVTENYVTMVWRDSMVDYVSPGWRGEFSTMADQRYMSNDKNIVVDLDNGDISFMLGVNQSFDSSLMSIIEGPAYTKDIVVPEKPEGGKAAQAMGQAEDLMSDAMDAVEKVLPNEIEKNNNPTRNKIDSDLKFANDYIKQLESLRSMLGR